MEKKQNSILLNVSYTVTALIIVLCAFRIVDIVNIRNLLSQNMNAFNNSMIIEHIGTTYTKRFNAQKYVDQLHGINASSCPKKFQLVWREYVQAWEQEDKMGEKLNKNPITKARKDIVQVSSEYGVRIQQGD